MGYCAKHFRLWRKYGTPTPTHLDRTKPCPTEGCEGRATPSGLCSRCYQRIQGPIYQRQYQLKSEYGLTLEDYDRMVAEQENGCAICGCDAPPVPKGRGERFVVDHDHESEVVRGLLCHNDNLGIGALGENADRLAAALAYLLYYKGLPARTVVPCRVPGLGLR